MLPSDSDGKMNTLALPATGLSGALRAATAGTKAASNCSSPSINKSGRRFFASAVACATSSADAWWVLPRVENDSIATRGCSPVTLEKVPAVLMAMSANCATVGLGTTPQSAKPNTWERSGGSMKNMDDRVLLPSDNPITRSAARNTDAVDDRLPAMQ